MYELLYTSVSSGPQSDQDLIRLLEEARERNEQRNITGMLVYNNREFMQLLEGEEKDVKEVFALIEKDTRHTAVKIFYQGEISKRSFGGWSMAFEQLDAKHLSRLNPGFEPLCKGVSPANLFQANPNIGKDLFLTLRDQI